jgi:hypothetical protein
VQGERDSLAPATPSSIGGDSYTGELAEPGTPLQGTGRTGSAYHTMPALPLPLRPRDGTPLPGGTPFAGQSSVTASGQLSESSMVATPTPRCSGEPPSSAAPVSLPSGGVSQQSEELTNQNKPRRRPFRLDEESKLLRKMTKVGQDLKLLLGAGGPADLDTGGRAHDNRVECMTAVMPYIFTAAAANQACDAQIRMWVQSHDRESLTCAPAARVAAQQAPAARVATQQAPHPRLATCYLPAALPAVCALSNAAASCRYGLHDTYHCRANRAARCMCVLPWNAEGAMTDAAGSSTGSGPVSKPWRILTGHDSGNVLMFDPSLPHLKPVLTIKFPNFLNVPPVDISVFSMLRLLALTRMDGTVQLMSMITPASYIMASAIDPTQPVRPRCACMMCLLPLCMRARRQEAGLWRALRQQAAMHVQKEMMDGVVSLEHAGDVLRLHDRRIDHVSTSSLCCDMATGTIRGNVSLWPRRLFLEKASEAGIMEKAHSNERQEYGDSIFRVTSNQRVRLSHPDSDELLPAIAAAATPTLASSPLQLLLCCIQHAPCARMHSACRNRRSLRLMRRGVACRTRSAAAQCLRTRTWTL